MGSRLLPDALDVVLLELLPVLVPPDRAAELRRMASSLPALLPAGFEIRLRSGGAVDFQVNLLPGEGLPKIAARHFADLRAEGLAAPGWEKVEDFIRAWGDSATDWAPIVKDLSFEFDLPEGIEAALPVPSLFVGFTGRGLSGKDAGVLRSVLAVIDPRPLPDRIWKNVHRCALACPDGARISYLGVMVSRPSAGLRLNVADVPADRMTSYLEAVGWPGPRARVEAVLDRVFPLVDGITLAVDVGESVGARLGLECVISQGRGLRPRQTALLDLLVELGCCSASERDALAPLPRVIGPLQSRAPWPASLIAKDIARPGGSSSAITLGLNHVKLDVVEDEPLRAKAYPYFQTSSVDRIDTSRSRPGELDGGAEVEACGADALEFAIERALSFLSSRRGQSGLWRDLHAIEGGGDHFVSAVVGAFLAETRRPHARAEAEATWRALLRRQHPLGGWGWSVLVTPDSDTTCWALRLAEAIGEGASEPAHRARRFLQERQSASGGLSPYLPSDFPAAQALDGIRGWTSAHDCMTAAAGRLPGAVGANARRRLRASQRADGSWRPYWWSDPAYATALAAEALSSGEDLGDAARVAAAIDWGLQRVDGDGAVRSEAVGGASTFVTAWLVRMLACGCSDAARDALLRTSRWLSAHQRTDGSWASSADMWVPPRDLDPSVLAEDDGLPTWAIICWDERRIFTTAVALGALERAKQSLETSASAAQFS